MKKRLLLITNGFPFGESERGFMSEEVKLLAQQFDLLVLALQTKDELLYPTDGILRIERFSYSSFRKTRQFRALPRILRWSTFRDAWELAKEHRFANPIGDLRQTLYHRFNVWEMEEKISKLVVEEKLDIVYAYWCCEYGVAAAFLKKRFPNLKVIVRFHGMDLYKERTHNNWQHFRKDVARYADGLVFACEYGRSYFQEQWGTKYADKMKLCYLGSTDRGELETQQTEDLHIISCSNLVALKQVDRIIEGLALLPETVRVIWDMFGDGVERKKLEELATEKFRNCPHIQWNFHGFVPNVVLADAYRKVKPNLFITTSSTEGGAPVSIQEAFSMGIPAIGTASGGIPDLIIDGQTGFLLPAQATAEDVANAVMKYAACTVAEKQQMATEARRRWSEKFNAKENAVQFAAYLQQLVSE